MTGGGFGGCTVNLVRAECAARFEAHVRARFQAATGRVAQIYTCGASDGARRCGA